MDITDANNDGIALDGIDPVAHRTGEPLRGKSHLSYTLFDEKYLFHNEKNLELFLENPQKYIPQAGGFTTGNVQPPVPSADGKYIGNKTFDYVRNLEDTPVSMENNVPIDMKEDGSLTMQNLSDSQK